MASTTYRYLGGVTEMADFVAPNKVAECFRDVTKLFLCSEHPGDVTDMVTFRHRFAMLGNMVRNAGQLPQPFWLGDARGGGSRGAARCAART